MVVMMMIMVVALVVVLVILFAVVIMMMIVGCVSVERRLGMLNSMSSKHAKHFAGRHLAVYHLDQIDLDNQVTWQRSHNTRANNSDSADRRDRRDFELLSMMMR